MRDGQIRAQWCYDSESGRKFLVDLDSCKVLAEEVNGKLVDPTPAVPLETPDAG